MCPVLSQFQPVTYTLVGSWDLSLEDSEGLDQLPLLSCALEEASRLASWAVQLLQAAFLCSEAPAAGAGPV